MRAFAGLLPALLAAAALAVTACARREPPVPVPPHFRGFLVGQPLPDLPVHTWAVRPPPSPERSARAARLILFWNCRDLASLEALAFVDSLAHAYPAKRLAVTTIHTEGDSEEFQRTDGLRDFLQTHPISLPVGVDRESEALHLFRFPDVPALVIVDGRGTVRGTMDNYRRSERPQIAAYLEEIVAGK